MSTSSITIWHCDAACSATAPERAPSWVSAIYTHGCPEHADLVLAHKATVDDETRGRGRSEKTTWWLRCACGWRPTPAYRTYTSQPLQDQHRMHVAAAAAHLTVEENNHGRA